MTHVELVRASPTTALLRVDLEDAPQDQHAIALVIRTAGGRLRYIPTLPIPSAEAGHVRAGFALPAGERPSRVTIAVGDHELPVVLPPERTREDAMSAIALQRARERLAELEQALAERQAEPSGAGSAEPERLEQQLAEHRVLRAQLTRELKELRRQSDAMQAELAAATEERDQIVSELEQEREGSAAERERLAERLQTAHQRVEYLERRVVEVQSQSLPARGARHHRPG